MTVDCMYSIFRGTYKNYEMILVIDGNYELKQRMDDKFKNDNNVIDDEKNNITIIENEKNEGPSVSRNRGVEHAKGDIVAFIDDDAFVSSDWLERIVKDFDDYSIKSLTSFYGVEKAPTIIINYENKYQGFVSEGELRAVLNENKTN